MASRESLGMQIALIVCVVLVLILGVTTFTYYSKAESERQRAANAEQQVQTARSAENAALFKYQALKFMISEGVVIETVDAGTDPMGQIREQLETELMNQAPGAIDDQEIKTMAENYYKHMAAFGLDSDLQRNYANLPDHLLQVVSKNNDRIVTLQTSNETLIGEKAAVEKRETERAQEFETKMLEARQDADNLRVSFNDHKKDIDQEKQRIAGELQTKDQELAKVQQEKKTEVESLEKQKGTLEKTVTGQRILIQQYQEESFEAPDGKITVVNHKLRICYINVGSADGLQRQQTFSVYDAGQTAVMESKPKGRIEVIQLIDDHLSLCKILEDETSNLIVPGDIIHTPAWGPGRHVRFVLVGLIDIDGDGRSDKDKLIAIIKQNGGMIDEDVTPQTRYLIEGERATDNPASDELSPTELADFNRKISTAIQIGVDRISVDKLLSFMGWKGDVDVVLLGTGESNIKVPRENTGRVSSGSTTEAFKKRTPKRGSKGAF